MEILGYIVIGVILASCVRGVFESGVFRGSRRERLRRQINAVFYEDGDQVRD